MPGPLSQALSRRTILVLDGAMGTELQRRGMDTGLPMWSANALFAHRDEIRKIHEDYIGAGADIITANTFRTTRRTMQRANLPDRSLQLTRTAVELALEARANSTPALIAGSIAPLEDCYRPDLVPPDDDLRKEHAELAGRLAEFGVDFLLVETMNTIREARIACEAGLQTGKEVMVSFVCTKDGDLLGGESLRDAVTAIAPLGPTAFSVNCVSPRFIEKALSSLTALSPSGFSVGVYGNVGNPESDLHGWEFTHDLTAEQYAVHAGAWAGMGATIIGGCCGTTPEYIRALKEQLAVGTQKEKPSRRRMTQAKDDER